MSSSFRPKSPSLNSLKSFEAAARHQSFVKAAHELNVTAGAIAQQVKQLEDWIGCPLFQRSAQGIKLTQEAQMALPMLSRAFDQLSDAVANLRHVSKPTEITIAALPSIALLWLSPKLPRISAMFPEYYFSVTALEAPPNFHREPFDIAVFYMESDVPGVVRTVLEKDELFPVCAPALLDRCRVAPQDHQWDEIRLLHDSVWRHYWQLWQDYADTRIANMSKGSEFSLYSLALQAAIDGAGMLIGRSSLVRSALENGQLVAPFTVRMPAPDELSLLVPKGSPLLRHTDTLLECLKA